MSVQSMELPTAELERVFAIYRFIARQVSPQPNGADGKDGDDTGPRGRSDGAGAKKSPPPALPGGVSGPMEKFRMAITNIPVREATVRTAREALHAALREAYPNNTAEVDELCCSDMSVSSEKPKTKPSFMSGSMYTLQEMHEVVPGLFLGSYHPASNKELLQKHNITHILCCIDVTPRLPKDFVYMTLPAQDTPDYNIARFFSKTFDFIDGALINQHSAVLVHCGAGISRAPTVAAAYLIKKLRLTASAAIALIQQKRPVATPNTGFRRQLRDYQEELGIHGGGKKVA